MANLSKGRGVLKVALKECKIRTPRCNLRITISGQSRGSKGRALIDSRVTEAKGKPMTAELPKEKGRSDFFICNRDVW